MPTSTHPDTPFSELLVESIMSALKVRPKQEVDRQVEEAKRTLEHRIPEIVAGVALAASRRIDIEHLRDRIVITLRMQEEST